MTRFTRSLIAGGALLAAPPTCYQDDTNAPTGGRPVVQVLLTDAPFPYDLVERVDVYVVEIAASAQADTGPGQHWVTIAEPRKRFNLLELQQGTTTLVGEGELPADVYRALRMTLDADSSWVTLRSGGQASVDWQTTVPVFSIHTLVEAPIDVPQAGADIVIDFDLGRSFIYGISFCCDFIFVPWIRAVNAAATGGVAGAVLADQDNDGDAEPLANARITVYRGDPTRRETWTDWASGHTSAQGLYRVAYLRPDEYIVEIDAPGRPNIGSRTDVVQVTPGGDVPLSVTLPSGEGLRIRGSTFVVLVGGTIALDAQVTDALGDSVPSPAQQVNWLSRNTAVATVASPPDTQTLARVSGQGAGQVYVVATSGALVDSVQVRVVDDSTGSGGEPVATVTVLPESATLSVGDSVGFQAWLESAQGNALAGREVTWSVSDPSVLHLFNTAGQSVVLRATALGTVSLLATSEGKTGSATVRVQ